VINISVSLQDVNANCTCLRPFKWSNDNISSQGEVHRWSILGQTKLSVLVSVMADRSLTPEGDRESKLCTVSNNRPRLGSDSSYVTLRETAKIKHGIRKKNDRQKPSKGQEKRSKDNRSVKPNPSHLPNTECCNGLCIHRLLQFLVLLVSVCSLTIIILMILGILGPDHCTQCKDTGEVYAAWCWSILKSLGRQFSKQYEKVCLILACWS